MARETGGTESEQRYFLEKVGGVGTEGSRVLMAISDEMKEGKTIQQAVQDHQKDLADAFKNEAKETSNFQRALLRMQDGVMKIGAGLVGIVMAGFKAVVGIIEKIWGSPEAKERGRKRLEEAELQAMAATDYIHTGVKSVGKGFGQGLRTVIGVGEGFAPKGQEKYKALGSMTRGNNQIATVTDEQGARLLGLSETAKRIGNVLKNSGLSKKQIEDIKSIYAAEEFDSGKGEIAAEKAARKALKGKRGGNDLAAAVGRQELVTNNISVRNANGDIVPLKIIIQTPGNFSGIVEGR